MQLWKHAPYLMVLGLLIIIAFATTTAIVDTKRFEASLVGQTSRQMLAVARSESQSIGSFLNDVLDDLHAIALDENIINILQKGSAPLSGPDDHRFTAFNIVAKRHSARTTTFHLLDRNGIVMACYPYDEVFMGKDCSVEADILFALEYQRDNISDPFLLDENKQIVFSMTVPIFNGNEFVGLLRRVMPVNTLKADVERVENAMEGTKVRAYVISDNGHLLYGSWAGLAGQNPVTAIVGASGNYDKFIDKMKCGEEGNEVEESTSYSGKAGPEKVIIAFAPIRVGEQNWSVGMAMPYDAVSKPIVSHSRTVFIFTGMILAGLIAGAVVFYRIQRRHYAMQVEREAERTRVMLESLGAACHHLGQPATVLLLNLSIVQRRMKTDDATLTELVKGSLEAVEALGEILHKLNTVNEYKTTRYLMNAEDEAKEHRIIEI
jgi:hypothetical protein